MNNKVVKIVSILIICMCVLSTNINAVEDIFDTGIKTGVYKFSEHENIKLPFFRFSDSRIIIDKALNKLGIIGSGANIDVDSKLSSSHLLISGDTVRINDEAENLAVIANNVVINGNINGNVIINATNVTISKEANINNDIIIFSNNNINVEGNINSNLISYAKNINIQGTIVGDLRCEVETLTFNDKSNVKGKIYVKSINEINLPSKYTNKEIIKLDKYKNMTTHEIDFLNVARVSIILALISTKTKIISNMVCNVKNHPIKTLLIGFGMIVLSIIIMTVLFIITIFGFDMIGIPLMIAYVAFMVITLLLSTFVIGSIMTEYIYNKFKEKLDSKWYKVILGFIIFALITLLPYVPVIGVYVPMVLYILTIGACILIFKKPN